MQTRYIQKLAFRKSMLLSAISVIGLSGSLSGTLAAQGAADDEELVFEEIVVTAGRREQALQDVAAAVTAIAPDDFALKGMKQIGDIFNYATGVKYADGGAKGAGNISARGVPQVSATPVFGIYLDDTPVSTNTTFSAGGSLLFDAMLMDVERVEIIKGPQGTLYGATSVGGMMRYISREPALEEFRASAGIDLASTKNGAWSKVYNGRASVPLVEDKLGITLSGFYQDAGGYVDYVDAATGSVLDEDVDGAEVVGYAADVLFRPTESLDIRLKYMKQETDFATTSGVQLAGASSDDALWGEYAKIDPAGESFLNYEIMSGTFNYDLSWATLSSTSSYVKYAIGAHADVTSAFAGLVDFFDGRAPGTTTGVDFDQTAGSKKFVQEVRLTSERMGNFEWLAGLYYADEDTFNIQSGQATPAFDVLSITFPSNYKEYAVFGDATYYFNEQFDVTAGMRFSKNQTELEYVTSGALLGAANIDGDPIKDTVKTYLFNARYRPTDNLSLYARVASGYRPASANIPIIDPLTGNNLAAPVVDADNSWSYEIGAKGITEGRVFAYDVAFWKIDWANFQAFTVFNTVSTGGNAIDGLSAHGFEGSFTLRPVDNFTLITNVTYSKSPLNSDEPGFGGVAGDQLPNLPEWSGSLQADYTFDLSDSWSGVLGGGLRYTGSAMSSYGNSASVLPVELEGRVLADLNMSVRNGNFTIGLYATNLFNKRALLNREDNLLSDASTVSTGVFERPRTIGANFKVDF